jgi:site-specific DNA recombinase
LATAPQIAAARVKLLVRQGWAGKRHRPLSRVPTSVTLDSPPLVSSGRHSDSTLGVAVESITRMTRAVLYARVSSDLQRKEGTIESQVAELKRQIAEAGHVLVKAYVDDGYSGTVMDRPGLEQLRKDLKTDRFDTIYFLCADRIAREVVYQNIIIAEIVKYRKQMIIGGNDYVNNPENHLTLGAIAEFERAKIIERTTRGKLHRLRQGQLVSPGHSTYGYAYVRKSSGSPPAMVINEHEAAIVRSIFDMYVSGTTGPDGISRLLEEQGVPTRRGKALWRAGRSGGCSSITPTPASGTSTA